MRVLFIGDVVGVPGCDFLRKTLPAFKRMQEIDFCVANGENSAAGNGMTPQSCAELFTSGVDLITGGNHSLRRAEVYDMLDETNSGVIRPFNMHRSVPGRGIAVLEKRGMRLGVANIMGSIHIEGASNPFDAFDEIARVFEEQRIKCAVVDLHAEATSEKRAMGFYADSRISAVLGTHTHVQTADAQILDGGTAYITDAGMTGVKNSVLGVRIENVLQKIRTGLPARFDQADGGCFMNCVAVEIDNNSGKAKSIESFCIE